ncbi:MAG: hypothetical protein ABIP44_07320 [Pseudoxanthomonas sp.]
MKFDEMWPHLERIPESEATSIYKAAGSDKKYRVQVAGLFAACICMLAAFSFAIPGFYRTYHPNLMVKLSVAGLSIGGIWLGIRLLQRLNQGFYNSAVMRQIHARNTAGGA